ncbi:4Fe-4S dicluster domain-containing protein [Candidatus Bathyarchaeota archaeon]|nr:4Fe-4S dicluster domain-containing protein [Candidatus Bathyarchaeota archaeon]
MTKIKEYNVPFSKEVSSRYGGETIVLCYQCGTCASSCPVAKTTEKFNPREIFRLVLLGERQEVFQSNAIWLCSSCYNCQERCPQMVEVADVFFALRNIAAEEGHLPNMYLEFASALINDGRIVPVSKFIERKREQIGLPPLKSTGTDALRKILAATGFNNLQLKKEAES